MKADSVLYKTGNRNEILEFSSLVLCLLLRFDNFRHDEPDLRLIDWLVNSLCTVPGTPRVRMVGR